MNINLLIDAIVQQTTVLIAQRATAAGARTSLSNTANQVFVSLVSELKQQGLGNKLIADMFGLSLRTYHNKIRRLSESSTEHGQSLWSAVLEFVHERGTVTRAQVLLRFPHDDAATIRSVLGDLTETGMIYVRFGEEPLAAARLSSPRCELACDQHDLDRFAATRVGRLSAWSNSGPRCLPAEHRV